MRALICIIVSFSIPGSFVGKQGNLRGECEISEATHADFFRAVYLLGGGGDGGYFVLFSPVSFLFFVFFKTKKLSQQLYIRVFLSDDGYQTIIIRI